MNPFLCSELIICHSFLQWQMTKTPLIDYPFICKSFYNLKKGTLNLPSSSAYRQSFLAFAFCWLGLFQYHKCLFGIVFQLTLDYWKSCQNRQSKRIAPSLSSAGELLILQDRDWTPMFVFFLSRYPSDTDNQIY